MDPRQVIEVPVGKLFKHYDKMGNLVHFHTRNGVSFTQHVDGWLDDSTEELTNFVFRTDIRNGAIQGFNIDGTKNRTYHPNGAITTFDKYGSSTLLTNDHGRKMNVRLNFNGSIALEIS